MSESNVRLVVIGAPVADKAFTHYLKKRKGARRSAEKAARMLTRVKLSFVKP